MFQILEISEKTLAERLVQKGSSITRDDISILLAEHLRTIEKLQQVSDAGKLIDQSAELEEVTPRMTSSGGSAQSLKKRPVSGKGRRKVQSTDIDSQSITSNFSVNEDRLSAETDKTNQSAYVNEKCVASQNTKLNRLPPVNPPKSKAEKGKLPPLKLKGNTALDQRGNKLLPNSKENEKGEQDSLQSSPETRAKNRRNLNESGIDSECDETETLGYEVTVLGAKN